MESCPSRSFPTHKFQIISPENEKVILGELRVAVADAEAHSWHAVFHWTYEHVVEEEEVLTNRTKVYCTYQCALLLIVQLTNTALIQLFIWIIQRIERSLWDEALYHLHSSIFTQRSVFQNMLVRWSLKTNYNLIPGYCWGFHRCCSLLPPSWSRRQIWTPGTTTSWVSIPMACWWQEPLPTSAPTPQASGSCFLDSPATCSCCPFGSDPRSLETSSCAQVWASA